MNKLWYDMTTLEKAEYCERMADDYGPGFCLDQVLSQAKRLRLKHEQETENKK
jgi:hypothetical protein